LIFAAEQSRSKGVRLRMLAGSAQVKGVIETSDVDDLLPLAD
jgi:hypothetical protein